jgi:predicted Zn-dependent protease
MARLGPLPSLALPAVDLDVRLGRWDSALIRLDALLRQAPSNPSWIARRAEILARAGRTDEARAERARALRQIDAHRPGRANAATTALARQLRLQAATETKETQ